ncbi:MAG: 23S rRNA (adenine(2503)-C(2))-methyltransferase RlmN [Proteobacteria bacterium]|nr:23S rRNA (adenine(2503)-C(2))-methyltransferase RlmN [Pseudomonadota bacterium]
MTLLNIFEMTYDELTHVFRERYGKGHYHSSAVYRNVFKKGNACLSDLPEFQQSPHLAVGIAKKLHFPEATITNVVTEDGVIKFLTSYGDGLETESVIIPMKQYHTLCVSTQVGCRQGCLFCKTGKMGFKRNLTAGEIISQVYLARFILQKNIRNIVFMGMGEPLDNFKAVIQSINVLSDQKGFDIAHRHITVSTVGLYDGIRKLGEQGLKNLNLAISLNAPNDDIRSHLMPVNAIHSMSRIKEALLGYPLKRNGFFLIAYVLIKGVNDSKAHAFMLADYLNDIPVRLNIVPYNEIRENRFDRPSDADVHRFSSYLEQKNVFVRKRWRKGERLHAGCGQLGNGFDPDDSLLQA